MLMTRITTMDYKTFLLQHFLLAKVFSIGKHLEPQIMKRIQKYSADILGSKEFLHLDLQDAVDVIQFDDLMASEGEVFEASYKWCNLNGENEQNEKQLFNEHFQDLIKWDYLSVKEFETKVAPNENILKKKFL